MICGIYLIQNKVNKMIYIGNSEDIKYRFKKHLNMLKRNKHSNKYLQEDWNKYDKENFELKILEECNKDILLEREMYYTEFYKSNKREFGYNIQCGNKHSEEHKLKMSKCQRIKLSEETKQKISIANKGRKLSEETKQKISKSRIGYKHSDESKEKMSNSLKGRIFSEKHKQNLSISGKNKKLSEIHKLKISESSKGKVFSKNTCLKLSNSLKGHKLSEETKQKISIANKGRKHSAESKEKMSIACKGKNSKITIEQSKEILEKLNKGISVKELSIEYNCGIGLIYRVKLGYHSTCR